MNDGLEIEIMGGLRPRDERGDNNAFDGPGWREREAREQRRERDQHLRVGTMTMTMAWHCQRQPVLAAGPGAITVSCEKARRCNSGYYYK